MSFFTVRVSSFSMTAVTGLAPGKGQDSLFPEKKAVPDPSLSTALRNTLQGTATNPNPRAEATRVRIDMREHSGMIVLEVGDNGEGITGHDIPDTRSLGIIGVHEPVFLPGRQLHISGGVEGKNGEGGKHSAEKT